MQSKPCQTSDILGYMKSHEDGITSMDAIQMFGATRLSAIIFELRKSGYNITSERENAKDRYGRTKSISRYRLVPDENGS